MKWGIYQNKIAAIIATFILLIFSYILLFFNAVKISEQTEWITHTYEVIQKLDDLSSGIKDLEYNFNGYLNMGRDIFRNRFMENKDSINNVWRELKDLTSDNPSQQQRIDALRILLDTKMESLLANIEIYNSDSSGNQLQNKLIEDYYSSENIGDVKKAIFETGRQESMLLQERTLKMERFSRTIKIINLISLLIALSFAYAAFKVYKKEYEIRKRITLESEAYKEELERRVEELAEANKEIKEYKQIEKFASTGRISRSIAHEVRNPLTNINLAAEQLRESIPPTEDNEMLLDMVGRNSMRINHLISNLLHATKFTELTPVEVSINDLLEDALALASDRINLKRISVKRYYDKNICNIIVDEEKMKIAFLNIIVNAIEAMPESEGKLTLKTSKKGDYCIIEVIDNGKGMDEEILSKLFEPYFTVKENGNGLGLTNTQNVILNHKGKIDVKSEVGKGTNFEVYLLL